MKIPIHGASAVKTPDRADRPAESTAAGAAPFTRNVRMTGDRTLGDAELKRIGAEILHLYQQRIIDTGGRRLAVQAHGEKWSIRGADIGNLVIHTPDGLIQLRPDGSPTRNAALPVKSWKGLEDGMSRALSTLREVSAHPHP